MLYWSSIFSFMNLIIAMFFKVKQIVGFDINGLTAVVYMLLWVRCFPPIFPFSISSYHSLVVQPLSSAIHYPCLLAPILLPLQPETANLFFHSYIFTDNCYRYIIHNYYVCCSTKLESHLCCTDCHCSTCVHFEVVCILIDCVFNEQKCWRCCCR